MQKNVLRNEKGFTLIEIIAVLVILGILAAVAIPKFFDLQSEARKKAAQGALAALQATASQDYAMKLLKGEASSSSYSPTDATVTVGDFTGSIGTAATGIVTVTVTGGPTGWDDGLADTDKAKSFQLFSPPAGG